jgi:hypothetical protein
MKLLAKNLYKPVPRLLKFHLHLRKKKGKLLVRKKGALS